MSRQKRNTSVTALTHPAKPTIATKPSPSARTNVTESRRRYPDQIQTCPRHIGAQNYPAMYTAYRPHHRSAPPHA